MVLSTGTPEYNKRLVERNKLQTRVMKLIADYRLGALVYPHEKQLVCKVGGSQNDRKGGFRLCDGISINLYTGRLFDAFKNSTHGCAHRYGNFRATFQ